MSWDAGDIYGPRLPSKPEEMEAEMAKDKSKSTRKGEETSKKVEKRKSIFPW